MTIFNMSEGGGVVREKIAPPPGETLFAHVDDGIFVAGTFR